MKRSLAQPSDQAAARVRPVPSGLPTFYSLIAALLFLTSQIDASAQQSPPNRDAPQPRPVTMSMQRHVGFTPTQANHIFSSAMCATCQA